MKRLLFLLVALLLCCSAAYATDIAIVEPPPIELAPLGASSLDDLYPPADGSPIQPSDMDSRALLEAILSRLDFVLFVLLPLAVAIFLTWLFCWWFNNTFIDSMHLQ